MRILVINGPNLNLLGTRQPEVYGSQTLDGLVNGLKTSFSDIEINDFQSNIVGE